MEDFREIAKTSAKRRKESIKIIPDVCIIDGKYLGNMSNSEFVDAFRELQELIFNIYEDVEKDPFKWGYPDVNNTKSINGTAYNRISDFFYAIAVNSTIVDEKMIVDMNGFSHDTRIHKKVDLIIANVTNYGLYTDEYNKKVTSFIFSYPKNPLVLEVLNIYAKASNEYGGSYDVKFASFSYRWVEDADMQSHEKLFLVKMDMSSKNIQDIQYWLYDKAKEYGYTIDNKKPYDKNCINYKKGSKQFILAGEREFGEYGNTIKSFVKIIFRYIFSKEPQKIYALSKKAPNVFGTSYANCSRCNGRKGSDEPCNMRICYDFDNKNYENCAYQSFWFFNPTLDTFKDIFELFVIENDIKVPVKMNSIRSE